MQKLLHQNTRVKSNTAEIIASFKFYAHNSTANVMKFWRNTITAPTRCPLREQGRCHYREDCCVRIHLLLLLDWNHVLAIAKYSIVHFKPDLYPNTLSARLTETSGVKNLMKLVNYIFLGLEKHVKVMQKNQQLMFLRILAMMLLPVRFLLYSFVCSRIGFRL